jgi:D-sedoheptulose 7-phosphate isomerase
VSGPPGRRARVEALFAEAIAAHEAARAGDLAPIERTVETLLGAFARGSKVLVFGNGGSAADAQHLVAELVGRFQRDRRGVAAIALTTDTSILTAVANDYGYERVFARQVEALGAPGDVAIGISTSGRSPNVLAAFASARQQGMTTIALTGGDGGALGREADIHVHVAHAVTARVQEVQRTQMHAICELIEDALADGAPGA